MKKIFYFASLLTVLVGAASCEKNIETSQDQLQPSGEYRQVTIAAGSAQTKTSVSGGVLTWSDDDQLTVVPQTGSIAAASLDIKDGIGTATGVFKGALDASIKEDTDLYGWCGGDWTYSSGSLSVNMPATQTYVENGLAEDAYPSIGTGSIKNDITLTNPMGVLKLTVKGAISDYVKSIAVTSASKNLAGSFSIDKSTYAVTGGSSKTVTLNVASPYVALSATGATFYIVLPPAAYAANDLSVKVTFTNDEDEPLNATITNAVTVAAGSATAQEVSDYTGRRGSLNGQEWVMIKAKYAGANYSFIKWSTQNLAVTASGKAKWNSTNYVIGDYFQWAASYTGYNITTPSDKKSENLVIYDSFVNTFTSTGNSFSFKTGKTSGFIKANAPYGGTSYSKYNSTDSKTTLEQSDDVATIVLGGTWRIPKGGSGEISAMRAVTYWAWDATDKGFYVFNPGVGTSGTAGGLGTVGTDDKTKSLLFFPAAGNGSEEATPLGGAGSYGNYWSSTIHNSNIERAKSLHFFSTKIVPAADEIRSRSFSVRPVSD